MDRVPESALLKFANFFVNHWLAVLTLLTFLFIVPIVGYPLLMSTDVPVLHTIAGAVLLGYKVTCHQLPERSLFIGGYKMAVCARCFAIYVSFLAGCILFAFVRTRLKIWDIKYYVLLCVPMAIDGFTQLFGVAIPRAIGAGGQLIWTVESTNEMRLITGTIFGLASALYVLPYLQEIFQNGPLPARNEPPK